METPNEFFSYLSAATSPISASSPEDSMNFYSAPTSPTSELSTALFGSLTEPTTPTRSYDQDHTNYSNFDDHLDFEFETSRHFYHSADFESGQELENPTDHEKPGEIRDRADSLPPMAFADELFCDGKVVPLAAPQLKLPPGVCGGNDKFGGRISVAAEPRSPRSVVKLPFSRQCLWNDDFDPFMVALENVREEEKRGKKMEGKNGRRARSLSPLRSRPDEYSMGLLRPHGKIEENSKKHLGSNGLSEPSGTASARSAGPQDVEEVKSPIEDIGSESNGLRCKSNGLTASTQDGKCSKRLAEPKGIVFARRVRQVQEKPSGPGTTSAQKSESETGKMSRASGGSSTRENKRRKIMRLLFGAASNGKESDENKLKDDNSGLRKPTFLRRLSFKSMRQLSFKSMRQTQYNRDQRIASEAAKMTIIQYRPRLFLCMGYGTKHAK